MQTDKFLLSSYGQMGRIPYVLIELDLTGSYAALAFVFLGAQRWNDLIGRLCLRVKAPFSVTPHPLFLFLFSGGSPCDLQPLPMP